MADRHKYTLRPSGVLDEVSLPVLNSRYTVAVSFETAVHQLFKIFKEPQ